MLDAKVFDEVIERVLEHEGGYVNDPSDPGGETKYGISKRSYPWVDIASLTLSDAREIYKRDYWEKFRINQIHSPAVAAKLLDMAVLMGGVRATEKFQFALRACGQPVKVDGYIGPQTLAAAKRVSEEALLAALRSEAAGHYRLLAERNPRLERFLKGWLTRAYT